MSSWESGLARPTGSEYFSNFNMDMYDKITGREIFFDTSRPETTMSPFFFGIWKNKMRIHKF